MKKDMMVVSINAVTDNIMEIELVPVVNINKQNDMMDVAMNGNVSQILKEIEDKKQKRDKIYLPREWLSDNNVLPFCAMTIDIRRAEGKEKQIIIDKVFKDE